METLSAWSNFALVLIGIGALWIYGCQHKEMVNQREADTSVHRPYLAPTQLNPAILSDGSYVISRQWQNFGSTPSKDLHIKWTWDWQAPSDYDVSGYKGNLNGTVAPNNGIIHDELPVSTADLRELEHGKHMYV